MNAIGIDSGGTNIKAVLITEQGEILAQESKKGSGAGGKAWMESVKAIFSGMKDASQEPFVAGLAAPGLPDEKNRKIVYMPVRLEGLVNLDWGDYLGVEVAVINDAHAALMAEARFGAARGFKHVLMLTLGTGVGGEIGRAHV